MANIEEFELDLPQQNDSHSLENFFNTLGLNIRFEDPFFHFEISHLFEHFKHPYPKDEDNDIIEELKASYGYETNQTMNPEVYESLMKQDNSIPILYHILEPKFQVKRNKAVYLNDQYGTVYTGAKQSYIDIDKLQQWVDLFHDYEFKNDIDKLLVGFILHLLYVSSLYSPLM